MKNHFFSVVESRTLGFGRRRYGRLSLATAGLLVKRFSFRAPSTQFFLSRLHRTLQYVSRHASILWWCGRERDSSKCLVLQ